MKLTHRKVQSVFPQMTRRERQSLIRRLKIKREPGYLLNVAITDSEAERNYRNRGQTFGAASSVRHIDPASVDVIIHVDKPIIHPEWIEILVDDAFWRVWKIKSLRMRRDGYRLCNIDGKWRAFYVKKQFGSR
jgi:hypothetical protein